MTQIHERTDQQLAAVIRDALGGAQALYGANIFVAVEEGAATLYGSVLRAPQAELAETIALAVPGITAVVQEMFVGRRPGMTDGDIARQAVRALRHTARVEGVRATVHDQTLTLTGEVDWQYERDAACRAVDDIGYVQVIVNAIGVKTDLLVASLEARMRNELAGYVSPAQLDIAVSANGRGLINLRGSVETAAIRRRIVEMAWMVAGVTQVDATELAIEPGVWSTFDWVESSLPTQARS